MDRKVFIIGNPFSGRKNLQRILHDFKSYLDSQQIAYSFFESRKDSPSPLTKHLSNDYTDLVVIGGDGTINEAVNALPFDIPIGIIPAGTGNDFSKNINIGNSRQEQFKNAVHGSIREIDVGICNGRKFLNGVGVGFDGQIVEDMAMRKVPFLKGFAAYYYHVLRILASYKDRPFAYHIDDQPFQKNLILLTIANGTTFGGGFKLTPDARIDDGLFDVCEIGRFSAVRRFLNIHRLSNGSHGGLDAVNLYQAKSIIVEANQNLFAHIDGERIRNPPFDIKVLPKSLKIHTSPDS